MNYIGLNLCDTSNGPGCRVSLFVSGCSLHCKDCFNKDSWDFNAGTKFTKQTKDTIIEALKDPYIEGFSLLGGEPFEPDHQEDLLELLSSVKKIYPNKSIWCWTGNSYRTIMTNPLLKYIDIIVTGPFIKSLANPTLQYRGSSNQQIIII